ncbi:MAG: NAD(P)H-binding protein, partial [Gammaproteobacteria bacterium]|nr:NAD(P)H-binding protein [Gammaproteobacteria bacterium]
MFDEYRSVTIVRRCAVLLGALLLAVVSTAVSAEDGAAGRIAVIGATARSGRVIIAQALEAGYEVVGLARSPHKLKIEHDRLKMFKGDVRDRASLAAALTGDEAVICMVGYPTPKDPTQQIGEVDLYTVMAGNLITAMQTKGNRRLIMASSTGVEHRVDPDAMQPEGESMSDLWRFNARHLYGDMADMEAMIADSGLEYVILRPGFMVEEPARHDLQFSTDGTTPKQRTITYADFAAFTLAQVTSDQFVGKAVGIYSDTVMD